jgi:hypothetical protein
MLTTNLEPVYGIILRILLVEKKMGSSPLRWSHVIIITVILKWVIKHKAGKKNGSSYG